MGNTSIVWFEPSSARVYHARHGLAVTVPCKASAITVRKARKRMTPTDRIASVLDHLGIARSHFATQSPGDIQGFIEDHADRVGGIALLAPPRIDPQPFARTDCDLLYVAPEGGMLARTAASMLPGLPRARSAVLQGYEAESWSDVAFDCPDIAVLFDAFFGDAAPVDVVTGPEESGWHSGVRYRALGNGPVLVVTPMVLAPSQWEPLLAPLAERFRVVELAGPMFGMLALLEQRAALPDWQHMCTALFDGLELAPGQKVLDVGCGSGAVAKQFVRHTHRVNPLTALDLSRYLLNEARISTSLPEFDGVIAFEEGSAESLPFEDNSFDAAYSITVFEECNAQTAIAELTRVVRPGGRIAIAVRGIDLHQWWNLKLSAQVRAKISLPAPSVAPQGVASSELYDLASGNGLSPLRMFTYTVACRSGTGSIFDYPEMYALSLLTDDERVEYQNAKTAAAAAGTLFMTRGHHCIVAEVSRNN